MKQLLRDMTPSLSLGRKQVEHEIGVAPTGLKKNKILNRYSVVHNSIAPSKELIM